jgi:hypothetical protein
MASEPPVEEPRREPFTESPLPAEPASDVKLTLGDGTKLRERVVRSQSNHGATFRFTFTKLDANDQVETADGVPLITHSHELCLQGEEAARLGQQGVANAVQQAREVAAAKAQDFFNGLVMVDRLFGDRINPVVEG